MKTYCPKCQDARECGDPVNGMLLCPDCGEWLPAPHKFIPANFKKTPPEKKSQAGGFLAGALILAGGAGMAYFFCIFDTTVSTASGTSVNNLGLLSDRQNGLILCAVIFLSGVILAALHSNRKS